MGKIIVHSAEKLTATDIQKVRYIMRMARDRDTALANTFPERFRKRDGEEVFFDVGKRRYMERVDCEMQEIAHLPRNNFTLSDNRKSL